MVLPILIAEFRRLNGCSGFVRASATPALVASGGATLVNLRAEHPDADRVLRMLGVIAVDLKVGARAAPALIAEIDCPYRRVLLS